MAIKRQNLEASKTRRIRPLLGRPFGGSAWRVNAGNLLSTFSGASACLSTLFMGPVPFGGRGRGLSASPRPVVVGGRLNSRWDFLTLSAESARFLAVACQASMGYEVATRV